MQTTSSIALHWFSLSCCQYEGAHHWQYLCKWWQCFDRFSSPSPQLELHRKRQLLPKSVSGCHQLACCAALSGHGQFKCIQFNSIFESVSSAVSNSIQPFLTLISSALTELGNRHFLGRPQCKGSWKGAQLGPTPSDSPRWCATWSKVLVCGGQNWWQHSLLATMDHEANL